MGSEVSLSTPDLQNQAVEQSANVKGQEAEAECSGPLWALLCTHVTRAWHEDQACLLGTAAGVRRGPLSRTCA